MKTIILVCSLVAEWSFVSSSLSRGTIYVENKLSLFGVEMGCREDSSDSGC